MAEPRAGATFLVVGDVHNHWRAADREYVERSGCDLALFVGDLGDEDVAMAEAIAAIDSPKAIVLGNHDAWQSFSQKRATAKLRAVIARLGADHVAYALRECYAGAVSLIGVRPFSWGGQSLRSVELYRDLYGVTTHEESAAKIVDLARRAEHRDIVLLGHNGPKGLSQEPADIWGKDFGHPGGDWGDEDLRLAIDGIEQLGLRVRAVIAGHMHDRLSQPRQGARNRFVRRNGTWFINAAVVPRLRRDQDGVELANFLRVRVQHGDVVELVEQWVDPQGAVRRTSRPEVRELPPVP